MKKAVIGLITFALIAMNGSAFAWDVDVTISVEDASVDLTATATTDDYILGTAAGIEGTGQIGVHGEGDNESGHLITGVSGAGRLYASQALGSAGCLVDCVEEQCDNCPEYQYGAASYATINGAGAIILTQAAGYDTQNGNVTGQILIVRGVGDFTAGMMSSLWIEGMEESVIHTMVHTVWALNSVYLEFME